MVNIKKQKDLVSLMLMGILTANTFLISGCSDKEELTETPQEPVEQPVSGADYNINNYPISYSGKQIAPITKDNWRQTEGIFLYTGGAGDASIHDTNNGGGYVYVHLPWHNGNVQSNLPNGFCDNITPEKGWQLAFNSCGSRSIANNNFFALYNKYTGTLRFFYYMPEGFSTGNDHLWEVALTDNLADHKQWGFALPAEETIKNRAKISATSAGTQIDYVTPWVAMKSNDGLIVPNAGWWAFDVDLSLYRPNTDLSNDKIRLQMRTWNSQHVSLYSTMTAKIEGTIKQEVEEAGASASSVASGVCTAAATGCKIAAGIASFLKEPADIAEGLGGIADALGFGSEFAGLFGGGEPPFEGKINLGLNGTIDTDGFIKGSTPAVGVASPTFQLKDFDLADSHIGQGVWNIKHHPVVYKLYDSRILLENEYENKRIAQPYFFDPSSIEVELNPEVFPESEVEWMQVDATCVATKGSEIYRNLVYWGFGFLNEVSAAYKVFKGNHVLKGDSYIPEIGDYMHYAQLDNGRTEYPNTFFKEENNVSTLIVGRGIMDKFSIEPLQYCELSNTLNNLPLTVNVVLTVKMKGISEPIQYSRNYLPEINSAEYEQWGDILKAIQSHKLNEKQAGHTDSYDYQVKRIGKMLEYWKEKSEVAKKDIE